VKTLFLDEIRARIGARAEAGPAPVRVSAVSTDSRRIEEGSLFFAIPGQRFDGHDFVAAAFDRGAAGAVVEREPDISANDYQSRILVVDDTVRALGRLARSYRQELSCPVIAVTGSNGKTTTKEMIFHILSKHYHGTRAAGSFNNHIGVPITLLGAEVSDEFLVAEVASNHPGELDSLADIIQPNIAVITMIGESHLEGFGDLDHVAVEKASLAGHVRSGGAIIINGDYDRLARLIDHRQAAVVSFGTCDDNDLRITDIAIANQGIRFVVNARFEFSLPVPGRHNAINSLAAIAVARRLGLGMDQIAEDFRDFSLPPMRLQTERIGTFRLLNDAYNANPASMYAAIQTLEDITAGGRTVFFCGDMLELGADSDDYHYRLGRRIAECGIDVLAAVGPRSRRTADGAISAGLDPRSVRCYDRVGQVRSDLGRIVQPGDTILLKGSRAMEMDTLVNGLRKLAENEKLKIRNEE